MKRFSFLLMVFAVLVGWQTRAENYPYRSEYLWVTVPDHPDWLYKTGQQANVRVEFFKFGIPRDGIVKYSIGNDMMASDASGEVQLRKGTATIAMGTRKTPGFRDLRLSIELDGHRYEHHVKVGFSVDQIRPYTQEPSDFTRFWEETLAEAAKTPLSYTRERYPALCTDKVDCDLIKLKVDQRRSVYAYLMMPVGAKKGACPAVLCPPGAGVKTIKNPKPAYAERGFIRLEMEIHGLDPRISEATFGEITAAFNSSGNGYLENGIDSRERYYMRHVYVAMVKAIDLLTSLPEWDGKNVAVQGGSQGGGLSLIAAGLDKRVTQCVANHPALADMAAYAEPGRTGGYPHFKSDILTPGNIRTLAYFDVINFARHISCPVRMTWGYNDNVCPPTTSYAVWNTLNCPKESVITPINEHWSTGEVETGHIDWILQNLR
ncbi:MAG: acetylxylan esterase [Bacteroidales bacterium]|nr:acetylxylan esterase [Bacteroidales bacterium]